MPRRLERAVADSKQRERRTSPRRAREEAVAEGVRNRVEEALDESEEGDDETPRVRHGPFRLTVFGGTFLALALFMGKKVIDILEYGGLEEYVPPITEEQKKEMQEMAEAARREKISAVFDPQTNTLLLGRAAKKINEPPFNEPLVIFNMDGQTLKARRSCAIKLLKANEKMKAELDHGIKVTSSFRSYEDQVGSRKRSYGKGLEGSLRRFFDVQKTAAAKPGYSFHQTGCAIDVKNWQEAASYLEAEGFIGGLKNGIPDDPFHFDIGRVSPKKAEKLRKNT